jgi:putative transposase
MFWIGQPLDVGSRQENTAMTDWLQHSRWDELRVDAETFADFLGATTAALHDALTQGLPHIPEPADQRFGPRWTEYQLFTTTGEEIAAELEVSPATLYNWRRTYGGMDADAAKELKELREQNARLKRLLAEAEQENDALLRGYFPESRRPVNRQEGHYFMDNDCATTHFADNK